MAVLILPWPLLRAYWFWRAATPVSVMEEEAQLMSQEHWGKTKCSPEPSQE